MRVYVYDLKTAEKVQAFPDVVNVKSEPNHFVIHTAETVEYIIKEGHKIVVYGQ